MLKIWKAKLIVNEDGFIYDPSVIDHLVPGMIVRIYYSLKKKMSGYWSHDSPYVRILEIIKVPKELEEEKEPELQLLCEVTNYNMMESNQYPVNDGERIRIYPSNIIEVPSAQTESTCENLEELKIEIAKKLSTKYVTVTGPLYTINYKRYNDESPSSQNDSDESGSSSSSESEDDIVNSSDSYSSSASR